MGIGTTIRHRLGPVELPAANAWRAIFINIADLACTLASIGQASRLLEIGCGDGMFANQLLAAVPNSRYLGIDIAPTPGRLFKGDVERAKFRSISTGDLLAEGIEPFDMVVIVDVLHHVPPSQRTDLLADAARLVAPNGLIAIKDWERRRNFANALAYAADRYVSGDRLVAFPRLAELRTLMEKALPGFSIVLEARIPPWRNNVLFLLTPSNGGSPLDQVAIRSRSHPPPARSTLTHHPQPNTDRDDRRRTRTRETCLPEPHPPATRGFE